MRRTLLYNKRNNNYLNLNYGSDTDEYISFAKNKNTYEVEVSPEIYDNLKYKSDHTKNVTITTPKVCLKKVKLPLTSLVIDDKYEHLLAEYKPTNDEEIDTTGLYIGASEYIIPVVSTAKLCSKSCDYVSGTSDNASQVLNYLQESLDTYNLSNNLDKTKFETGKKISKLMSKYKCTKFILLFNHIENFRNKHMTNGGWRWDTHGKYIGTHKPKHTYLDEEKIKYVLTWKLVPIELK